MTFARCSGNGVNGIGTDMTQVGRLPLEEDEEVYLGLHRGEDTEVGPDHDRQLNPRQSLL